MRTSAKWKREAFIGPACATLYTYCIYELRMSEDAAFRRAKAARLVRQYPELTEMIAKGELHLTGLLMIGPHLGGAHHAEILARARFRSKREIHRLIVDDEALTSQPEPILDIERPLHYKVQFTASQEYVNFMNEAFELLGHEMRRPDLVELELRAMREFVRQLKKRKRAAMDGVGSRGNGGTAESRTAAPASPARQTAAPERGGVGPARQTAAPAMSAAPERGGAGSGAVRVL